MNPMMNPYMMQMMMQGLSGQGGLSAMQPGAVSPMTQLGVNMGLGLSGGEEGPSALLQNGKLSGINHLLGGSANPASPSQGGYGSAPVPGSADWLSTQAAPPQAPPQSSGGQGVGGHLKYMMGPVGMALNEFGPAGLMGVLPGAALLARKFL